MRNAARKRTRRTRVLVVSAAGLAVALGGGVASAAPARQAARSVALGRKSIAAARPHWVRITPLRNDIIDDIGLVRGSDGIVHALWSTDGPGTRQVIDSPVNAAGSALPRVTIAKFFLTTDPDATMTRSGLAVLWNGIQNNSASSPAGTFEATRPRSGGSWSVSGANIPPLPVIPFTSSSDTATEGSDGLPFVAFSGTDSLTVVHMGHPEVELGPTSKCCVEQAGLATDRVSGRTWITYASIIPGHEGIFARPLAASGRPAAKAVRLPGSVTNGLIVQPHQRVGTTGRGKGHAGVFAIYEHGEPFARSLLLSRLGSGRAMTVATLGQSADLVNDTVTADAGGSLYAGWVLGNPAELFVRRSNPAASKFGPVLKVALPAGTTAVWKVYISAAAGHADLFVLATQHGNSKDTAYWHIRVSPRLP